MIYRRAIGADYEQMLELQQSNLLPSLSSDQLSDGFLSRAYSLEQFQGMNNSIAVIVALENKVRGYLCAATLAFNQQFPFPAALFKEATNIAYQGKNLTDYLCCLVNPICIEKDYRGTEIFLGLCQNMLPLIAKSYELALAFVSTANPRSLQACQKMMQVCGQFSVDDQSFWILTRDLRSSQ